MTAEQNLERYAASNQFTIHNVPGDGNCLYNAVLYQLDSNGVITTTVENLRQMVANYLEEHADSYMPFVISPIASDNLYNHDTSTSVAIDDFISSIPDQYTSSVLAYERYVERVRIDSWGDHVVIAALANMFHVTINVVHARQHSCTVATTPPVDNQSICEVNLGLAMQYHFVGLDKRMPRDNENPDNMITLNDQSISNDQSFSNNQSNNQPTSPSNVDTNDHPTTFR